MTFLLINQLIIGGLTKDEEKKEREKNLTHNINRPRNDEVEQNQCSDTWAKKKNGK